MKILRIYPKNNILDVELIFEPSEDVNCHPELPYFASFVAWLRRLFTKEKTGHKWRVVERWRFPFGEPMPTTLICKKCFGLARRLVSKEQEGEVIGSKWVFLGYVNEKFRDYDPYNGKFDNESWWTLSRRLPFKEWK